MIVTEREREAETQAEEEAGSMQGARRGTRSRVSRIAPWAKGRRQTTAPLRDPLFLVFHIGNNLLEFKAFPEFWIILQNKF